MELDERKVLQQCVLNGAQNNYNRKRYLQVVHRGKSQTWNTVAG